MVQASISRKKKRPVESAELFPHEPAVALNVEASMRAQQDNKQLLQLINKTVKDHASQFLVNADLDLRISKSKLIHSDRSSSGLGLFATSDIEDGEEVCWYIGKAVTKEQAQSSSSEYILLRCDAADYKDYSYGPYVQVIFLE